MSSLLRQCWPGSNLSTRLNCGFICLQACGTVWSLVVVLKCHRRPNVNSVMSMPCVTSLLMLLGGYAVFK